MCYHNKCGQLDKDNCLSPLNFFHKAFTVPIDGTWITTTFLRATFFRNINVPDITHVNGFSSLLFLCNRALSFNIRISKENMTGQGFARFKCGIIKNHWCDHHAGTILHFPLFTIDDRKALQNSRRGKVKKYSKYVSKKYEERLNNEMIHVKVNAFIQQYLSADH